MIIFQLVTSCSFFIYQSENSNPKYYVPKKVIQENPLYCEDSKINAQNFLLSEMTSLSKKQNNSTTILSSNEKNNKSFFQFLEELRSIYKINLTPIEKFTIWALLQMNMTPHLSSPTANLSIYILSSEGTKWFNYTADDKVLNSLSMIERINSVKEEFWKSEQRRPKYFKEDSSIEKMEKLQPQESKKTNPQKAQRINLNSYAYYPYLFTLEQLLKSYPSSMTLLQLAELIDFYYKLDFIVDHNLDIFLRQKSGQMSSHKIFKKYYFHEDDILKEGEKIPKVNFSSIIKSYRNYHKLDLSKKIYQNKNELFSIKGLHSLSSNHNLDTYQFNCSFSNEEYKHYQNPVKSIITPFNVFGFVDQTLSLIAYSNQDQNGSPLSFDNSPLLLLPSGTNTPPSSCFISNNNFRTVFIAHGDRDSGQHLYHLLERPELFQFSEPYDLNPLLQMARYAIYPNPLRIVLESKRMSNNEISKVSILPYPIYHAPNLGEIHILYGKIDRYYSEERPYLFRDPRSENFLSCFSLDTISANSSKIKGLKK